MKNLASMQTNEFITKQNRKRQWLKIVTALSCVVVFCTAYALILPAITMEKELYCGYIEHTEHKEACYSVVKVCEYGKETDEIGDQVQICGIENGELYSPELICGQEEISHEHGEDCYAVNDELICSQEEHSHDSSCYDESGALICEIPEHIHDESCYQKTSILTCTETGHIHDTSCYSAASAEGHIHTDACYHVHTEACFEKVLTCDLPIHEHSLQCYSNPELTESRSHWERSISGVELTGVWADNLVAIAQSQLGYEESTKNYEVQEDGTTIKGYTRYGDWFGNKYGDWCAMFVSFCLNYSEISQERVPYAQSCFEWVDELTSIELYTAAGSGYAPQKGDIIFFDNDSDGLSDHVGIVAEINDIDGTVKTIEGNNGNCVASYRYLLADSSICGYGMLPENAAQTDTDTLIEHTTEDGVTVTVTGNLPEGAEIQLSAVPEDILAEILAQVGSETPVFAYDITIMDGGGSEWQPDELGARVSITGLSMPEGEIEIAHIQDEGEIERIKSNTTDSGVEFSASSFSIYVGYTVDFEYNGLFYSIPGDGSILLSEIFTQLEISRDVSGIVSVAFSNSELLSVEQTDGDWLLTSLVPFDTEETLTVIFADGEVLTVTVTDARSDSVTVASSATVSVSVNWKQAPGNGNILVTLYKDGDSTGRTLTLSDDNSWEGQFTELEAGAYSIEYTTIDGYDYSVSSESTETSGWAESTSLAKGNTYLLVQSGSTKRALQNSSGTTLSRAAVTISGTNVTGVTEAMQWYYNGSSLQNVATANYLKLNSNGASTDSSTQNQIVYENGHIKRNASTARYLRWYNNAYTSTTSSSNATSFTLYTKTAASSQVSFTITGEKQTYNPDDSSCATFEHNKTIDYLGDGVDNPDTALSGEGNYRLYLDMTGKQEPVDLLIVVDGSGSMSKTDVDNMRRDAAITRFLNGSTSASNNDGFLSYFLGLNSDNKVSVVQFYGVSADRDSHYVSNNSIDYTYDSTVLLSWTGTNSFVNCTNKDNSGTDYEAGLKRATNQFAQVSGDGHKKIMLFLSDGVPTYFLIDSNDVGTDCNGYTITSSNIGKRWGTGVYTQITNYPYCKNPSKKAFDDFMAANPGVTVFTIGVSADISETSQSESQSPEVLKYMAEKGGGAFLSVESSMSELKLQLESIFYPKGVTITDNFSKYVRYSDTQPDVLVTMTEKSTGTITYLYQNGALTSQASGVLSKVTYTAGDTGGTPTGSTGTVSAVFDGNYQFQPEYTYTLSFNVKTTQTAYDEYSSSGYNATGDANTDYGTNTTSSGRDGFYSNDSAIVSYIVSGNPIKEQYRKPVVQVTEPTSCTLTITKTVAGTSTESAFPFELTVTDSSDTAVDLSGKQLPSGVMLKGSATNVLVFSLADGESVILEKLIPIGAKLTLSESEHSGYAVAMKVGDLGNYSGDSQSFDISSDLTVAVTNTAGVRLPETGGTGTLMFTLGGLFLITGAYVYGYILRRRRERRAE